MNTQTFGALVQTLRKQKAMTQEQLANEINVTSKAVSRWERGIGLPDISMIKPLADALGTGVLELMVASPQAGDIVPENEWVIETGYFRAHCVDILPEGQELLPPSMRDYIKTGKRLWVVKPSENGMSRVRMKHDEGEEASIPSKFLLCKLRIRPEYREIHEEPIRSYLMNGGSLYIQGEPVDGKVIIRAGMGPNAYLFENKWKDKTKELESDPVRIADILKTCVRMIKDASLSLYDRQEAACCLRDYLVHCIYIKELDQLTELYRDKVDEDLITLYKPKAILEFVNALSEAYQ